MKNYFKPIMASIVFVLMFAACDTFANTYGAPYEIYPHGGTGVNSHEFMSPANATNAAAIANYHTVVATLPKTSENCTAGQPWTYYTFDAVIRPGQHVATGYVHFWRQDC